MLANCKYYILYFLSAFRVFLYPQVNTIRGQMDNQSKQEGETNNRIQKSAKKNEIRTTGDARERRERGVRCCDIYIYLFLWCL